MIEHAHVEPRARNVERKAAVDSHRVQRARRALKLIGQRFPRILGDAESLDYVVARAGRNDPQRRARAAQPARNLQHRSVAADGVYGFRALRDRLTREILAFAGMRGEERDKIRLFFFENGNDFAADALGVTGARCGIDDQCNHDFLRPCPAWFDKRLICHYDMFLL